MLTLRFDSTFNAIFCDLGEGEFSHNCSSYMVLEVIVRLRDVLDISIDVKSLFLDSYEGRVATRVILGIEGIHFEHLLVTSHWKDQPNELLEAMADFIKCHQILEKKPLCVLRKPAKACPHTGEVLEVLA
jgi:hypothetical protein